MLVVGASAAERVAACAVVCLISYIRVAFKLLQRKTKIKRQKTVSKRKKFYGERKQFCGVPGV